MIQAPDVSPDRFSDLVAFMGGVRPAARALRVSVSTLREWLASANPPHWAGPLLWFHTSEGREAAARDVVAELRYVIAERNSLRAELERRARLLDETKGSLLARVKALEFENQELRKLFHADTLADEIGHAHAVLAKLLQTLNVGETTRDRMAG
jgi:hypothetical protein